MRHQLADRHDQARVDSMALSRKSSTWELRPVTAVQGSGWTGAAETKFEGASA